MAQNTGANLMGDIRGNGYVKWKGLVIVLIPLLGSMLYFSYTVSEKNISKETFRQFEKRFESSQDRIEKGLTDLTHALYDRQSKK